MSRKTDKIKDGFPRPDRIQVSFTSGLFNGTPLVAKRRTLGTKHSAGNPRKPNHEIQPVKVTIETSDPGYLASSSTSKTSDDEVPGVTGHITSDDSMEVQTSGSEGAVKKTAAKLLKVKDKKGMQVCLKAKKNRDCLKDHDEKRDTVCLKGANTQKEKTDCLKKGQKRKLVGDTSEGEDADTESSAGSTEPSPKKSAKAKKAKKKARSKSNTEMEAAGSDGTETNTAKSSGTDKDVAAKTTNAHETTGNEQEEAASAGTDKADRNGNWTASQDSIIISMKAGNETWASIGKAIGCGKKEVQKRHKELMSNPTASPVASHEAIVIGNDGKNEVSDAKSVSGGKKDDKHKGDALGMAPATVAFASENTAHFALSQQQAIAFRKIYGDHYKIHDLSQTIQPDRNFNERDCEMLAMLAAKHRVERWLELQASFFNVTGRMVSVDVLKHKMAGLVLGEEEY